MNHPRTNIDAIGRVFDVYITLGVSPVRDEQGTQCGSYQEWRMNQSDRTAVKAELDRLTTEFFRAVSFEPGEIPPYENIYALFIEAGLLVKNTGSTPEISSVRQFIEPRQELVRSGELTRFNEAELSETTEIFGNVAHRFNRTRSPAP